MNQDLNELIKNGDIEKTTLKKTFDYWGRNKRLSSIQIPVRIFIL